MIETRPDATKLRRARDIVAAGWTQGEDARDANGNGVFFESTAAVCHCTNGALMLAGCGNDEFALVYRAILKESHGFNRKIIEWNDDANRTKDEVLAMLDGVIKQAEAA